MDSLSDERLIHDYLRGGRDAFDALFRRYAPRVHATAYRLTCSWEDAEDTLQDVFIKLAGEAHSLRRGSALASWIYRSTVNRAIDCLRKRRSTYSLDGPDGGPGRIIAVESLRREAERRHSEERESLLARVEGMIPRLPERQAAAFVLRHFQGLSHRGIAAVLGCSEASSKSHHSLACRRLRELIAKADAEAGCTLRVGADKS